MFSDALKSPAALVPGKAGRIASIDQFRGYAIFGMMLVNLLGKFASMPDTLKHHIALHIRGPRREALTAVHWGRWSRVFMLLMGTLAYDMIATGGSRRILLGCLGWGLLLSALGFAFRAQWFGVKAFWPFSQCAMSSPYTLYSTGLCFLAYIPFYLACDLGKLKIPTLTIVGSNPLVLYVLHGMYLEIHNTIVAPNSGIFKASAAFIGFYLMFYAVARYLYRNKMFIKL